MKYDGHIKTELLLNSKGKSFLPGFRRQKSQFGNPFLLNFLKKSGQAVYSFFLCFFLFENIKANLIINLIYRDLMDLITIL
jgi:hypothetical protein